METVANKKLRRRRSFTPEFKSEIVEACSRGDRSIGQVARDFDLTETAVREWVKQADIDAGRRDGLSTVERDELSQLCRENRRLREDVEILKRATAFFAKETRRTCGRSSRWRKRGKATSAGRANCSRSPVPPTTSNASTSRASGNSMTPS